jgi:carbonic anhydrase/acetyltransferase-like protein (isoleucine patch superfamily)
MGPGVLIAFPPGDLLGEEHIAIGASTVIAPEVSLSVGMDRGQPLPPGAASPVLRIGARCSIGRGSHVVAHRSIVIGDDVMTGPHCYITDQNHVYADPDVPIGQQWPSEDPVEIGSGSWLGAGAIVLPGTRLGRNTVVGAGSVVRGEFPDHAVLVGAPARAVRHWDAEGGWQPPLRDLDIRPPEGWGAGGTAP